MCFAANKTLLGRITSGKLGALPGGDRVVRGLDSIDRRMNPLHPLYGRPDPGFTEIRTDGLSYGAAEMSATNRGSAISRLKIKPVQRSAT